MKESTGGEYFDLCLYALQDYYQNKGLTIIGLNDSQGVNTTTTFFKKGLLEYIATALTTEKLNPTVINAFSLLMNKTEHINYFLENNLSLEEIKLSQVYSVVSALEKVMQDIHLPKQIGNIGYLYKLIYNVQDEDKNIKIASELQKSSEPTVIYSSGVNDLMREVANNPFNIKRDYKQRNKNSNFYYTLEKSQDPKVLKQVLENIKRNIENILTINYKADIYPLGAYVPVSLQKEEMNIFKELIIQYNEDLIQLCKEYNLTFIDTQNIGKSHNKSELNFHITSQGHNELANYILMKMYETKILSNIPNKKIPNETFEISNKGIEGMLYSTYEDYEKAIKYAEQLSGYNKEVQTKIASEHLREAEVLKKVLIKTYKY